MMQPGSLVRIKAPKGMGKSSLLVMVADRADELDYACCDVDFLQTDIASFSDVDRFLRWFCQIVAFQLGISPEIDQYWDTEIGSKVSATIFFENHLLQQLNKPLLIAFNEVDRLLEYGEVAKDFLSLMRFWYEQGQRSPLWQNLRIVMAYSTEAYVPLKIDQSPFNVGTQFRLEAFTPDQVRELARRYQLDCEPGGQYCIAINTVIDLLGGHPCLTIRRSRNCGVRGATCNGYSIT